MKSLESYEMGKIENTFDIERKDHAERKEWTLIC